MSYACEVQLKNTEIINSEFYIDFSKAVEKILTNHNYTITQEDTQITLTATNYITTSENYLRLKQANIKFEIKTPSETLVIHELSNCLTVSCPASNYVKALKKALKKLDSKLLNCE